MDCKQSWKRLKDIKKIFPAHKSIISGTRAGAGHGGAGQRRDAPSGQRDPRSQPGGHGALMGGWAGAPSGGLGGMRPRAHRDAQGEVGASRRRWSSSWAQGDPAAW